MKTDLFRPIDGTRIVECLTRLFSTAVLGGRYHHALHLPFARLHVVRYTPFCLLSFSYVCPEPVSAKCSFI
eukprot:COSAG06_NODE_594_length_13939_cov_45.080202_5_plen_71_part_00